MSLEGKTIGVALTGSHCTIPEVLPQIEALIERGASVIPILSYSVASTDTRFGRAQDIRQKLEEMTGAEVIDTISKAEPIGPKRLLDCLVIAPCTGNTLSKLALGITDTPVLMAAKAQLRNGRPVVVGIATNDGLSGSARNIATLHARKNVYFIPYGQDDPKGKPTSLVARMCDTERAIEEALAGKQVQPMLVEKWKD
ncbi:MAG TPA: dipicolinate synthase subunit B [Bacillota bacterium]|jgi:dipicolinate synthase subunit B|nr:dipicolinate synthase subunit B [Bacillota bacterium]HNY67774.1 dipicolinate synthase subunit B [Bacillota bacterium]HOI37645.1 dipicolinate synthase subunit B [Bacillota bacterium]HPU76230.1 dipicolinate synthase subunit B [Bacillota bacterium]